MKTQIIKMNFRIGSYIKPYSKKQLKLKKKHRKPKKLITQLSVDFVLRHVPEVRLQELLHIAPFGIFRITSIDKTNGTMVAIPREATYNYKKLTSFSIGQDVDFVPMSYAMSEGTTGTQKII